MSGTLTPRGIGLLGGGVLLWAVGRLLGVGELHIVAVTSVALVGIGGVAVAVATATISARRHVATPRLDHGAIGDVRVELRNDARLPSSVLLVEDSCHYALLGEGTTPRFVVPGLGPGRVVSVTYRVQGHARGRYPVGPLRVHVQDPFGLTQRTRRYAATDSVLVYPPIEELPAGTIRGRHHGSGASRQRRLFSAGDEFYTMREYADGDDLRQVHWPSTAHRQRLMVRQQEQPWQAQATILLDARRAAHRGAGRESTFEKAVSVAASVVAHLAERGYRLQLVTEADGRGSGRGGRGGRGDRLQLLERLAELQPSSGTSMTPVLEALRGGDGLLIAVVTPEADTRELLRAAQGHVGRIGVVVGAEPNDQPAEQLATLLAGAGWQALTVAPGEALGARWASVITPSRALR